MEPDINSSKPPLLGDLTDPTHYTEPLDVANYDAQTLIDQLRTMLVIRSAEEVIGDNVTAGKIACPCHLGIGQEAIAVGVSSRLRKTDRIFGGHRSHSHYLAQGGDLFGLFAEVLGKENGCSKGMGGSMHLYDAPNGFVGSVPIVAGTIPLAVGAALAAKKDGRGDISIAYFGDGATEEGNFHESLNFASNFKLPVLFVCENNLFSSHLHISLRQPDSCTARFAAAHKIAFEIIDGNDIIAVSESCRRLTGTLREGKGPAYLEVVTYRWRGHVGPREDMDVGVKRGAELPLWKHRDPVRRLADGLKKVGALNDEAYSKLQQEVKALANAEWKRAEAAPYPPLSALIDRVYARENDE